MIASVFLMAETTIAVVFVGIVLAGGGALYIFNANNLSSSKHKMAPNKDLINEKKAELLEYDLKPRPSKVIANHRQKIFDERLANIDLEAMSEANKHQYNKNTVNENTVEKNITTQLTKEEKIKKDLAKIDDIINTRQ